jgi:rhamnose transport system substrate-binding protein
MEETIMKKTLLFVAVFALALAACAPAAAPTAAPAAPAAQKSMFFMAKVSGIPYFEQNSYPGAQEAGKELGYNMIINSPEKPDPSLQSQLIDSAVAQGVVAILPSADDPAALCPSLKKAMDKKIVVVAWDSDVNPDCRQLFQNQADTEQIGRANVIMMCAILGGPGKCTGDVAILSAGATMTNQNTWIQWMKEEWKDPKYAGMKLVTTVYGDDVDQKSYDEALGLFKSFPNLVGIISPTSVGIAAAARAVEDQKLQAKIKVTGLGLPNELKKYVKSGTIPEFALWVPKDQAYLAVYMADALLKGTITGKEGDKFTAGRLGNYTVGKNGVVILGLPTVFDKNNIDNFNF